MAVNMSCAHGDGTLTTDRSTPENLLLTAFSLAELSTSGDVAMLSLLPAVSTFAPGATARATAVASVGSFVMQERSAAIPFLKKPPALDGTLPGDVGFDPLGFSTTITELGGDLSYVREAELMHGRQAMLATVGFVFPVRDCLSNLLTHGLVTRVTRFLQRSERRSDSTGNRLADASMFDSHALGCFRQAPRCRLGQGCFGQPARSAVPTTDADPCAGACML